jgi:hypothetical protein
MYKTYFDGIGYQGWNQILTQLRFIHNRVVRGIQWMVCWWVLVHCGCYLILMVVPHLHQTGGIIGSQFSQNWDENSTEEKMKRTKLVFVNHVDPQRNFIPPPLPPRPPPTQFWIPRILYEMEPYPNKILQTSPYPVSWNNTQFRSYYSDTQIKDGTGNRGSN